MSLYLLDTNIVSDMIRNPHGNIFRHIEHVGQRTVATSIIVASELRFGVERRPSMRLIEQMEKVMATISVLPFDVDADVHTVGCVRICSARARQSAATTC